MADDLELAFWMATAADAVTASAWRAAGTPATEKADGTPVTEADVAAEAAMLSVLREHAPDDAFLGEESGSHAGTTGRRWIVDGIDGTRFFAAGAVTWGTLVALEVDGRIMVGVCSSPLGDRRWWAVRGAGAFAGRSDGSLAHRIHVSAAVRCHPETVTCLPRFDLLAEERQGALLRVAGGQPTDMPWSHQCRVAEGSLAACVWFGGDIWDHAAPSIIVEEAGGRFSDHHGGGRLDTRTAIYSNGRCHDAILEALRPS